MRDVSFFAGESADFRFGGACTGSHSSPEDLGMALRVILTSKNKIRSSVELFVDKGFETFERNVVMFVLGRFPGISMSL